MKVHSSKTLKCFFKCFQVFLKCFSSIIINSLLLNDGLNSTVQIYSKFIRNTWKTLEKHFIIYTWYDDIVFFRCFSIVFSSILFNYYYINFWIMRDTIWRSPWVWRPAASLQAARRAPKYITTDQSRFRPKVNDMERGLFGLLLHFRLRGKKTNQQWKNRMRTKPEIGSAD
jgi:hypothetical protein